MTFVSGNVVIVKLNSFDISQIRLICNKNKKTPATDPLWICAWKVKHTCTLSLPLGVDVGMSSDQNKALASSANIRLHAAPRASTAATTRCGEGARLFSVFSQFVWQPYAFTSLHHECPRTQSLAHLPFK